MKKKISEKYLKEQIKLHENTNYGIASLSHAPTIKNLMAEAKLKSLSDYGAGKKNLQKGLLLYLHDLLQLKHLIKYRPSKQGQIL